MLEVEVGVEVGELDRRDFVLAAVGVVGEGAGFLVVEDVVLVVFGMLADVEELVLEHTGRRQLGEDGVVEVDG